MEMMGLCKLYCTQSITNCICELVLCIRVALDCQFVTLTCAFDRRSDVSNGGVTVIKIAMTIALDTTMPSSATGVVDAFKSNSHLFLLPPPPWHFRSTTS